ILPDIEVLQGLKVEFYYQTDKIYKVVVKNHEYWVYLFSTNPYKSKDTYILNQYPIRDFTLSKLFYTEVVNYSHYAYNSNFEGDWIEKLFHKNDSYQTPVVFNPMRNKGNSDINTENLLVKQRLITNLLNPIQEEDFDFRILGENLIATKIKLRSKPRKDRVLLYEKRDEWFSLSKFKSSYIDELINRLFIIFFEGEISFEFKFYDPNIYRNARAYILYKLISITIKYNEYKNFFLRGKKEFNEKRLEDYFRLLKNDNSHITFKLKQTLNFLYYQHLKIKVGQNLAISKLSEIIERVRKQHKNLSIIDLIPPPIFDFEIILNNKDQEEDISFSTLSSGEKQLVYSVSSILYHLINLDSVSSNKVQYKNINIVLEEIELYFHPNMQRKYISYLLNSIKNIKLKNIQSINIQFITHSPFVLSDIPSTNIMFLKVNGNNAIQEFNKKKTFGANIHDLLADNFFFDEKIYIGKFAMLKISEIIKEINQYKDRRDRKVTVDNNLIPQERIEYLKKFIHMIDERILKLKLAEMLSEVLGEDDLYNNLIDREIEYLKSRKR
ncbi:MAG: hypothetical protein KDC67_13760, partial [Ignavibacteriae bacterium]|nr:hypothetical protein [Ignavibacteriota bacterium]